MSCRTRGSGWKTRNHDYVVAWTDGASVCNQDSRFRRAGCGVFFGINDNRNCSFTLLGREQTNNRAELLAVITAMKIYDGNLEIRSDSDYVVRAANCRMRGEIQRSNLENSDLWKEFDTALSFYGTRQVKFTWVKGHATMVHINRRITTTLDKGGNDAGDALEVLTDAALVRQRTALATHCFASELLFRRRLALLALPRSRSWLVDGLCSRSGSPSDCVKCAHGYFDNEIYMTDMKSSDDTKVDKIRPQVGRLRLPM